MSDDSNAKQPDRRSPGDDTGVGLDVDRVLEAAGLGAPSVDSELDLDVDFDLDELEEGEMAERLPFRFETPPIGDTPPNGSLRDGVDPFANTMGEPSRLSGSTPLSAMSAVRDEPQPVDDPHGSTHLQVAEMLQSRMKQRGYTPIGTPVALNSVPDVARQAISQASPVIQSRSEQVATRNVGVVSADADSYDTREVLVQAPDPFEDDESDGERRADIPVGDPSSANAESDPAGDSRLPTPAGSLSAFAIRRSG